MTIEQMIADTISVTNYLRQRFGKEKIYVMGHSWGSMLGMLTVQQAPQLFHAYIGIGQVSQQVESERLAYTYMLNEFRAAGNSKMVRKLEKFPIDKGAEISNAYLSVRGEGMMKLGIGVMHQSTKIMDCVMKVLRYKGYSWKDKLSFPIGMNFSMKYLWDAVMQIDLVAQVPRLEVPVYVLHGKYDYQVSYILAKDFLRTLQAPIKGFYTFEDSAHSPCFEEPEKMCKIFREDVLQSRCSLADILESN